MKRTLLLIIVLFSIELQSGNIIWRNEGFINTLNYSSYIFFGKTFNLYPNPASDYIEINVGAGSKPALMIEFEIFNIFGEKNPTLTLPAGEGTSKVLPNGEDLGGFFRVDISNLAPGVYFIKIGDRFEKFVKW
jgi:hypothetical protein